MNIEPGYEPLAAILQEALDQAQRGKGKECHSNGLPFLEQPIMTGGRECGAGGLLFQARKKLLEAYNCKDDERAIADLLGAINYTAAMVILRREVMAKRNEGPYPSFVSDLKKMKDERNEQDWQKDIVTDMDLMRFWRVYR